MCLQLVAQDLVSKLKLIDASQHLVDAKSRLGANLGDREKLKEEFFAGAQADRDGVIREWQRKLVEDMAPNPRRP
jgi:hypothetical protein